jgi:hypothetical protein
MIGKACAITVFEYGTRGYQHFDYNVVYISPQFIYIIALPLQPLVYGRYASGNNGGEILKITFNSQNKNDETETHTVLCHCLHL